MQAQIKQFRVEEFIPDHQEAVEQLVLPIQQGEFNVGITRDEQEDLVNIAAVFQNGNGNFWVAIREGQVIGSIGLVDIGNDQVALKKMFVHRDFRGKEHGVAAELLGNAKRWCREHGVKQIFLGTVAQMIAAHKFYEKNGFVEVGSAELPANFPIVHVDSKFYGCRLATGSRCDI